MAERVQPEWRLCDHGVAPYLICLKCQEQARQEKREEHFYEILDRFSAAVDKLAEKL